MHSSSHTLASPVPASQPCDLLLVESEDTAMRYAAALRDKFRVTHAATLDSALRAIERVPPALVVMELAITRRSCSRRSGGR